MANQSRQNKQRVIDLMTQVIALMKQTPVGDLIGMAQNIRRTYQSSLKGDEIKGAFKPMKLTKGKDE